MPLNALYNPSGQVDVTALWQRAYLVSRLASDDLDGALLLGHATGAAEDGVMDVGGKGWPPDILFFRQGNAYEWIVQGTSNVQQLLLHVGGTIDTEGIPTSANVNKAWLQITRALISRGKAYLAGKPQPGRIIISGHSYGGAVAAMAAQLVQQEFRGLDVQVVTYGSPRWSDGKGFAVTGYSHVRVVNDGDPVPRVPPQSTAIILAVAPGGVGGLLSKVAIWKHVGQRVLVSRGGGLSIGGIDEEEPFLAVPWNAVAVDSIHPIAYYRDNLAYTQGVSFPAGWTLGSPPPAGVRDSTHDAPVPALPTDNVDVASLNRIYYGQAPGPITLENRADFQSSGLVAAIPQVSRLANISGFSGGNVATPINTITKVTLVINNGQYGHAESHFVNIGLDTEPTLGNAVGQMAQFRQLLLGNAATNNLGQKGKQTPKIEYVRLTDAYDVRRGKLYDWENAGYIGLPSTNILSWGAEAYQKVVAVRMTARDGQPNPTSRNVTLQLVGFPDIVADGYKYKPATLDPAGSSFGYSLRQYVNYLANFSPQGVPLGGNIKWGIILSGKDIRPVPFANGNTFDGAPVFMPAPLSSWQFKTKAAHGLQDQDRVRITGAGSVFNGVWEVAVQTSVLFTLRKGPVSGHTAPLVGFVYAIERGGVPLGGFAPYALVPNVYPPDNAYNVPARVSKHNPGRQWFPTPFARRIRRER